MSKLHVGATGRFPYGKLSPQDEGEIGVAVGSDRPTETVLIEFGTPVKSLGMRPEQAEAWAASLVKHARRARGEEGSDAGGD